MIFKLRNRIQNLMRKSSRYRLKRMSKMHRDLVKDYDAIWIELENTKKRLKVAEEQIPKYKPIVIPCGETESKETANTGDTEGIVKCGKCMYYDLDEMYCHFHGKYVLAKINGVCCNVYFEKEN